MKSYAEKGLSLIEVVAGLALMGSLLAVVLVSSSQHLRQLKAAERKRTSVQLLDNFLANWSANRFSPEEIEEAVQRSGLAATGSFGSFGVSGSQRPETSQYQVNLVKSISPNFDTAAIVRLTVSVDVGGPERQQTAWAEVLVPQ